MTGRETVVVVAHPDDEVLWFSSVLPEAGRVVIAFGPYAPLPQMAAARDAAVAELPLPTSFLRLDEACSYLAADWSDPTPTEIGLALERATPQVRQAYAANYSALRDRLRPTLRPDQVVFSHNPWGEYGHEDHVLVFRVVQALQREIGFTHRVSAYVAGRSAPLAEQMRPLLGPETAPAAVDSGFTGAIRTIYQRHACWTWDADYAWPKQEWFIEMGDAAGAARGSGTPRLIEIVRS